MITRHPVSPTRIRRFLKVCTLLGAVAVAHCGRFAFAAEDPDAVPNNTVPVFVVNLVPVPQQNAAVIILATEDRQRYVPITIGAVEAEAIWRSLNSVTPSRPLTHELLSIVIRKMGGTVRTVVITAIDQGTFKADLHLELPDGSRTTVDARPSDSIAIALKAEAPLFVTPAVLRDAGQSVVPAPPSPEDAPPSPRRTRPPLEGQWL